MGHLCLRREATAIAFTLKLLDGKGRGVLKEYVPQFMAKQHDHYTQHSSSGMQLVPRSRHN